MTGEKEFSSYIERLVCESRIVIDRPRGSAHPRMPEIIYPLDYGYLEGTTGGDRNGIDVWLGSGDRTAVNGISCTVDLWKRDMEIKVLLGCSKEECRTLSLRCILLPRPPA